MLVRQLEAPRQWSQPTCLTSRRLSSSYPCSGGKDAKLFDKLEMQKLNDETAPQQQQQQQHKAQHDKEKNASGDGSASSKTAAATTTSTSTPTPTANQQVS